MKKIAKMKKTLLWAIVGVCCLISAAGGEAAFVPSRGAVPETQNAITTEAAKSLPDDTKVVLRGTIQKHLRKDYYEFRDESGTVTVEIDDDDWHGLIVSPDDRVELRGEVDRDFNSMKIEVEFIEILKP